MLSSFYNFSKGVKLDQSYTSLVTEMEALLKKLNNKTIFDKLKSVPKGFYIHGLTGSGKTTIVNLFYENLKTHKKINMHFHDYFLDISKLLTKYSLPKLIQIIASKLEVLCFDEFFIESIADAKLLKDIFTGLVKKGVIIIITSNFIPEKLYEGGFNRELIFPEFSNFLNSTFNVKKLISDVDFREKNYKKGEIIINSIPEIVNGKNELLTFSNHKIKTFCNSYEAIFEYEELFKKPRSVIEFTYITRFFDVIYIKNFKPFRGEVEDEIIRFRNFIDLIYTRGVKIFLEGNFTKEEIFEQEMLKNIKIKRTYSRIVELAGNALNPLNPLKRKWSNEAREFFQNL